MTYLKKNKSTKYYLNQLPINVLEIINEKIPIEKKYKDKIKNKKKINNEIKNLNPDYINLQICCDKKTGIRKLKRVLKESGCEYDKKSKNMDELFEILCDNEISICCLNICSNWWYNSNPKSIFCDECDEEFCYDCSNYIKSDVCLECMNNK